MKESGRSCDHPVHGGLMEAIGALFNVGYLMLALAIPLSAVMGSRSLWVLILLTATPGVFLLAQRLLSGPLTDAFGEVFVLRAALGLGVMSGVIPFLTGGSLVGLLFAQMLSGSMRGLFWTAAQSFITGIGRESTALLGRFMGASNFGGLVGIMAAGFVAHLTGFRDLFGIVAALQGLTLSLVLFLPSRTKRSPSARSSRAWAVLKLVPHLFRLPAIWIAGSMALLAAVPQALVQSFYPVYLLRLDHSTSLASVITATRNVGTIVASLLAGYVFRVVGRRVVMVVGLLGLASGLGFTGLPLAGVPWLVPFGLFITGASGALINVLYISLGAEAGGEEMRASSIAVVNMFWSFSMLMVPMAFGVLASWQGMRVAFRLLAVIVLVGSGFLLYGVRLRRSTVRRQLS